MSEAEAHAKSTVGFDVQVEDSGDLETLLTALHREGFEVEAVQWPSGRRYF
jgi:hypothetical protein